MNRREVLALILVAPAMARQALTEGKWLTIATPGWNRNGRKYGEGALASMAEGIKGKFIVKRIEDTLFCVDPQVLASLAVGAVSDSRRGDGGSVQVQVKWLGDPSERVEGVLAPAGVGHEFTEPQPGRYEITKYEPQCLELSEWSGWEGATRV